MLCEIMPTVTHKLQKKQQLIHNNKKNRILIVNGDNPDNHSILKLDLERNGQICSITKLIYLYKQLPLTNKLNMTEIPLNATIRQEYVKCGNPDCQNQHGPYFYAYWKQDKKLNKRYIGKHLEDFRLTKIAKQINLKPSILIKFKFIEEHASKGNVLSQVS
jgi:hypothetical protein